MQAAPPCPRMAELEQLLNRTASPEEMERAARHLEECTYCAEGIDAALAAGALLEAMRQQPVSRRPEEASAVERLIERIQAASSVHLPTRDDGPVLSVTPIPDAPATEECAGLAPPQRPDELGRLGPYRVLRLLGKGGMGLVFEGEDTRLQRRVALKVMQPGLAQSASARERFLREARAAAALQHDYIVIIHEVNEANDTPYLAMQLLQGQTLEERLRAGAGQPLAVAEILGIGRETAEGLAAAHARGILHRDIKPANIFLANTRDASSPASESDSLPSASDDCRVKLLDFGLARAGHEEMRLTRTGVIAGTPSYMPPEQARGQKTDERGDLFSLGCVLYEMCTGRAPFTGRDPLQILRAVTRYHPRPPLAVNPLLPEALSQLVVRLLEKDPGSRPPSAQAVADALRAIEQSPEAAARPRRSGPRFLLGAGALMLVLLGGICWWLASILHSGSTVRIDTPRGQLVIETTDPDVELVLARGGRQVLILDLRSSQKVELDTGDYTLSPAGGAQELKIEMPETFSIRRGETTVVTVRRVKATGARKAPPEAKTPALPPPSRPRTPAGSVPVVSSSEVVVRRFEGHRAFFTARFSPDGRLAVSAGGGELTGDNRWVGGEDFDVRVWEVATGREVSRLPHSAWVFALFTPDGRDVMTLQGKTARFWDPATGNRLRQWEAPEPLSWASFSPDGKHVVAACADRKCRLFDSSSGKVIQVYRGHESPRIDSVAFSPDGKRVCSAGADATVRVWDTATGRPQLVLRDGPWFVRQAVWSPDGRFIVAARTGSKLVQLWDAATGKLVRNFSGHTHYVESVAVSPDGKRILSGSCDQTVRLWDLETGQELKRIVTFQRPDRPHHTAYHVVFHPDGQQALVSCWDKVLYLLSLNGALPDRAGSVRQLRGHQKAITCLALSPDASRYFTGSEDGTVRIWEASTGRELARLAVQGGGVIGLAASFGGRILLTGDWQRNVRLWDLKTGKEVRNLEGVIGGPWGLAFTLDGRRALVSADDAGLRLFDLTTGKTIRSLAGSWVNALALAPDGVHVLTGGRDGVALWDLENGKIEKRLAGHRGWVRAVAIAPDGRFAVSGSGVAALGQASAGADNDSTVIVWDLTSGEARHRLVGHTSTVTSVAVSPDSRLVLTGSNDGTLRLWDAAAGKELRRFTPQIPVRVVAFTLEGHSALAGCQDGVLRVYPLGERPVRDSAGEVRRFLGHLCHINSAALSADGRFALSGGGDGTVRLWEVATGTEVRRFEGHKGEVTAVALAADGRRCLSAGKRDEVRLWDVATGKELLRLRGYPADTVITGIAFSPDGRQGLTTSLDRALRLWDLDTGRELRCFNESGTVQAPAFLPDGKRVLAAGEDNHLHLIDLQSGREQACLRGHTAVAWSVVVSVDGRRALSGGADGTMRLWDLEAGKELSCLHGHADWVWAVALSRDGRLALSAGGGVLRDQRWLPGTDRTIRLWDLSSGRELHRFVGHLHAITSIHFTPDGSHCLSASRDKSLRLWRLPTAGK